MKRTAGFTLIELMITVSIAAVLLGIGVPALSDFVKTNRRAATINTLVTDIQRARAESITQRVRVILCRSTDGINCVPPTGSHDWSTGWVLFHDINENWGFTAGVDQMIHVQPAIQNVTMPATSHRVVYRAGGGVNSALAAGTIAVCVDDNNANGRMVVVAFLTGRHRLVNPVSGVGVLNCN